MRTMAPDGGALERDSFCELVEALRKEILPEAILQHLKALFKGISKPPTGAKRALTFVRAGGLPVLITHLSGTAIPSSGALGRAITDEAAESLLELFHIDDTVRAELSAHTCVIPSLINALSVAPTVVGRSAAAVALQKLADARPEECLALVEARVVERVLLLFIDILNTSPDVVDLVLFNDMTKMAGGLMNVLVRSETGAAGRLRRAISTPKARQAFAALLLLQECLKWNLGGNLVGALTDAGIVTQLVATLEHESAFCIAAAAGALAWVGAIPEGGQGALIACGGIPALVGVIKRRIPPCDLEGQPAIYRRPLYRVWDKEGPTESLRCNDPSAMAVGSLCRARLQSGPMLASFLEAGGVDAVLQMLKETSCPLAQGYTAQLIGWLVLLDSSPQTPRRGREIADKLVESGLCQAAVKALKRQIMNARVEVLTMLNQLFMTLSVDLRPAAVALLVEGNVMELILQLMIEAGPTIGCVSMMDQFAVEPRGHERLCSEALVEQLIPWAAKWLLQAEEWPIIILILQLLNRLLQCPACIPTATKGNLTPGLVRALRMCRPGGDIPADTPIHDSAINLPVVCLEKISDSPDKGNSTVFWKPAIDAGIVPILSRLLETCHVGWPVYNLLKVSASVLMAAPHRKAQEWAGGLPRAIAGVVRSRDWVPAALAAETLLTVGRERGDLIADIHTWGMEEGLQRLKMRNHTQTSINARALLKVVRMMADAAMRDQPSFGVPQPSTSAGEELSDVLPSDTPASPTLKKSPNSGVPVQSKPGGQYGDAASASVPTQLGTGGHDTRATKPDQDLPRLGQGPTLQGRTSSVIGASPGRPANAEVSACALCKTTKDTVKNGKLLLCSVCKSVRYCGKGCQKADWPSHKAICKSLRTT